MLFRFIKVFLPKRKHILISWWQSPCTVILEPEKIKSVTVSVVSPSVCHEMMGLDAMIFIFLFVCFLFFERWVLSQVFHSYLSLLSRDSLVLHFLPLVVSSAYLRLLIFLLTILIPACASSSPAICMMHSAYKLNKQGDNIQPWCTPSPIWNQSIVSCPVLTVASWTANRFLRRQVRWSGILISLRIFQFVVIHTVKGFRIMKQ